MTVTPELLAGISGVVLSLLFSYIPGLRTWFAALAAETKQLIMLLLLLLISIVIYGLGCYGVLQTDIACDKSGIMTLVSIFISSVIANQGTHKITPEPIDVRAVKRRSTEPVSPIQIQR